MWSKRDRRRPVGYRNEKDDDIVDILRFFLFILVSKIILLLLYSAVEAPSFLHPRSNSTMISTIVCVTFDVVFVAPRSRKAARDMNSLFGF